VGLVYGIFGVIALMVVNWFVFDVCGMVVVVCCGD
jgi:hypothetical protein